MDPRLEPGYDPLFLSTGLGLLTFIVGALIVMGVGWLIQHGEESAKRRRDELREPKNVQDVLKGSAGWSLQTNPLVAGQFDFPFEDPRRFEEDVLNLNYARLAWAVGNLRERFANSNARIDSVNLRPSQYETKGELVLLIVLDEVELPFGIVQNGGTEDALCRAYLSTRTAEFELTAEVVDELPKKVALAFAEDSDERTLDLIFAGNSQRLQEHEELWGALAEWSGWEDDEQL